MKYQLMNQWGKKAKVSQLCDLFCVSRSGFYAAKLREKASVICSKTVHLKAEFASSGKCDGSRRLMTALQAKGITIGRYKVRRLMRQAELTPVWKRKFINTTDRNIIYP
jgi:putative transposase